MRSGSQKPRVESFPDYVSSSGKEAVELAATAGLFLDPWQAYVLEHSLGERPDGKWSAFEVGIMLSRQNGKGAVLEARELAGLFLLGEEFIVHSAHQFDTSLEAFRRLLFLVESSADLSREVKRVARGHGDEGIELMSGQRIRFRTRTKGGGRGFSGDCLILDEAMVLPEMMHGALLPTLSARPNPQVWYAGSAVDQNVHEHGLVFARVRQRGLGGQDPSLAYFEWSLDKASPDDVNDDTDPENWAATNPGLGIRISEEYVGNERRSMDRRTFVVERLGVGDWPSLEDVPAVIDLDVWRSLSDPESAAEHPVCFALDVSPLRTSAAIGVAGRRADGLLHVEVVDRRQGTGWLVERIVELVGKHDPAAVIIDGASPAASLVPQLVEAEVPLTIAKVRDQADACGLFFDTVEQKGLRHLGTDVLLDALRGASQRPLGDAWAWSRKNSSTDISPLVACTLALWGTATQERESIYERRGLLVLGR